MEIRILLDITDKFEKAIRRIACAIVAGGYVGLAKDETAKNRDVPAEEATKSGNVPKEEANDGDAPKAKPSRRAKAKKAAAPAVGISTPAGVAEGDKERNGAESTDEAETEPEQAPATAPENAPAPAAEPEPEESEDELGKGAVGEVISELTGKLISRMNEEARDKATINRNLRAKCEELQLKFPTVPALIQAIGYGNAYKACIGEG